NHCSGNTKLFLDISPGHQMRASNSLSQMLRGSSLIMMSHLGSDDIHTPPSSLSNNTQLSTLASCPIFPSSSSCHITSLLVQTSKTASSGSDYLAINSRILVDSTYGSNCSAVLKPSGSGRLRPSSYGNATDCIE